MMILRLILHFAFCICVGVSSWAQETLTLNNAIELGLQNNFSIQIAHNDQSIAVNNNTAGNAGMLPSLDVEANRAFERENVDLDIQGSEGIFNVSRDWAKSDRLSAAATLNWTLFDGMGMFMAKERLETLSAWGELNTQQVVQNTVAEIMIAYYQILLEQEKLRVLTANLEVSQRRQDFAQNRYEVGKGSKLDYLSAQVDYNSDQSGLIRQEEFIENAKVDLNLLLSRAVDSDFQVSGEITPDQSMVYTELENQLSNSNPEILMALQDHNAAYYQFREEQASRYPSLSLDLSYNYVNQENEAGQLRSLTSDGVTYGVTARWNIFNGFNTNRRIQNARIQHQSTLLAMDDLKLQLTGQLRKVYNNYTNSLRLMGLEEANLSVAEENEEIAIARFQLGASNSLELREAQRNLVDANSRLLDAKFATKLAEIELLRLSGNLVKSRP